MRIDMKRTFLLVMLLLVAAAASAGKYRTETDIRYRDESALKEGVRGRHIRRDCRLDIAYEPGISGSPVVIWFHPGGLSAGKKEAPKELCAGGIVVVGVEYRKLPDVEIPDILDDCAASVAWVRKHISEYGGDPSRIYIAGHSAGGYVASMLALDRKWLEKYAIDPDKDIRAYAPFSGQCISHYAERNRQGIGPLTPTVDSLSPLYHVRKGTAPFIVVAGDSRSELYGRREENAYFVRMMKLNGNEVHFYREDGFKHGDVFKPGYALLLSYMASREGLGSSKPSAAETEFNYTIERNIRYKVCSSELEEKNCVLDVAYRKGEKDLPVVVWIHGGGLTKGKAQLPASFLRKGYVVIGIDYRKLPDVSVPVLLDDCAEAVSWALKHIPEYGGSLSRVFLSGHSGGGYIVSMLGLDKQWLSRYGVDPDRAFKALAPISGQCISHYAARNLEGVGPLTPRIDSLSPLRHVRGDAAPMLVIVGDREQELYGRTEENEYFVKMLRLNGHKDVRLCVLEGFNHGTMEPPARDILCSYIESHR